MATGKFWSGFRRWRRRRPFWGSVFLVLAGLEMLYTANSSFNGMQIHIGPTGFLSYVLPAALILAGVLSLVTPAQRVFYGIVGLLAALYSFIGLNLGGFFVGMLLGIVGGALVIAWGPPRVQPGAGLAESPPEPRTEDPWSGPDQPADIDATQQIAIAGHDDRPAHPRGFVPGFTEEEPPREPSRFGRNPKALAILLVPLAMTATLLVAGSRTPASADDECPKGLPSRSYATSASASVPASVAAKKKAVAKKTLPAAAGKKSASPSASRKSPASPASSLSPAVSAGDGGAGNMIVDGINDFVDGVGNLLGLGDEESPSPSESPTPSQTVPAEPTVVPTTPAETTAPATSATPTTPAPTVADPTRTPTPTKAASSATVAPSASSDVIPCLGPRVFGKTASADDIPQVANKPGLMEVDSLTLYDSTYDGVVDMPTAAGSYKALKFSMTKATNKPFSLTIDKPNGTTVKVTSANLVTEGTVKFYTSELKGKLFGLIPVTFTPDSPPPLTLPLLWFTDVTIQLGYVRCDTLTGDPLKIAAVQ